MKERNHIVEITPYMRLTVERFGVNLWVDGRDVDIPAEALDVLIVHLVRVRRVWNGGEARAGGEGAIIPLEI